MVASLNDSVALTTREDSYGRQFEGMGACKRCLPVLREFLGAYTQRGCLFFRSGEIMSRDRQRRPKEVDSLGGERCGAGSKVRACKFQIAG